MRRAVDYIGSMKSSSNFRLCLLATILAVSGCGQAESVTLAPEESLAGQIEDVRRGARDQIFLETTPLTDAQLAALPALPRLRVLLLDSDANQLTDAGLAHLENVAGLQHLRLRSARISNAGLTKIADSLPELRILNLPQANFGNEGLAELARLPKLEQLRFSSPAVTDAGIAGLREFPELKRVHLIDVPITDASLTVFAELPQLESLYIDGVQFSDAALEALFAARPQLHVHLGQRHHDRDPHKDDHRHE